MTSRARCLRTAVAVLALTLGSTALAAQQQPAAAAPATPATPAARPPARPADVESVDAIMAAVYDVISGPAGQKRDWDRFRSLMAPGARLVPTGRRPDGTGVLRNWSVEEYVTAAAPQLESGGFFEREIGRKMERYGNVVHLMSAYDSKRTLADPAPFQRGVNSFQLWFDGKRWYVVSIFWEPETPERPIPAELLNRP
jgi:hypothetical protein